MKDRTKIALSLLVLLAAADVCLAQPAKTYRQELTRVRNEMNRRRYTQVPRTIDTLLKSFTEPHQVKELRLIRNEALLSLEKYTEALAALAKLQAQFKADKDLQTQALLMTGQALQGQKKYPEAIAAYQKLAKDYGDYGDRAAQGLLRAGDIQVTALAKPALALATFAAVEKQFADRPSRAAEAAAKTAAVLETVVKDNVKAAAAYEAMATKYAAVVSQATRSGHFNKAIDLLRAAKKLPEAAAVAGRAEKALTEDRYKVGFALRKVDVLMELKKHPQARAEADRLICTYPTDANTCQAAQARIVVAYRSESKFAEGLAAARALYGAAGTDQHIRAAAGVVAAAFRSMDGDLGRANQFLTYQRFGPTGPDGKPNTPDDVKVNHLAAVRPAADAARDKRFAAAVAARPKTHEGYRAKGFLYAYWGKGKEAAQQFRLAFKAAPEKQVPAAAGELVLIGMKSHTSTFHGLERVFEYISYGPKGKDGKQNIADPFKGL